MKQEMIMVRYGELSTKGKNIGDFIKMLGNNIKRALKKYQKLESSLEMLSEQFMKEILNMKKRLWN